MNLSPIANLQASEPSASGPAAFDAALDNARGELTDGELDALLLESAVNAAGPMLIMPRANEIFGEAMSDD